jgi:hypothetical protein
MPVGSGTVSRVEETEAPSPSALFMSEIPQGHRGSLLYAGVVPKQRYSGLSRIVAALCVRDVEKSSMTEDISARPISESRCYVTPSHVLLAAHRR